MKNLIGLNAEKSKDLAGKLNVLLANYQIYYQNLRGFHWNIKGPGFFELHIKFEELYNQALLSVDEIAERILTLGHTPLHSFTAYVKSATIKEEINVSGSEATVSATVQNLQQLVSIERDVMDAAAAAHDEGTLTLISDYIAAQEKTLWMLSSYLK